MSNLVTINCRPKDDIAEALYGNKYRPVFSANNTSLTLLYADIKAVIDRWEIRPEYPLPTDTFLKCDLCKTCIHSLKLLTGKCAFEYKYRKYNAAKR